MRILTGNHGLGQFEPGAWRVEAEHEVVRLDKDHVLDAWAVHGEAWWEQLLPEGWVPDVALFYSPEYHLIPPRVWDLPCPVALWVGDWYIDPNGTRLLASHVDLVLSDAAGAEAMRRAGIPNVAELSPWAFDPAMHQRDWDAEPLYDVSFVGSLNDVIHVERNGWLHRVMQLPAEYRVHVGTGVFGDAYGEILRRTRIGFNHSVAGGVNMRCFEVTASGSLLFVERANRDAARWFRDREECVLYGPDDFEELVAYYLENEDERRAVAEAGWKRVRDYAPEARVPSLVERLEALASAPRRRRQPTAAEAGRATGFQVLHMPHGQRPYPDLEVALDAAESEAPDDAALLVARAILYTTYAELLPEEQRAGVREGALEYLDRAIAAEPGDAVARFDRGAVLLLLERTGESRATLRALLDDLDAGHATVFPDRLLHRGTLDDFYMGWLRASLDEPAAALERLTRLLTGEIAERLALLTPDRDERLLLLERAVHDKNSLDARRSLAAEHGNAGDYEIALELTEQSLAERPLVQALWEERLLCLLQLGRPEAAREAAYELQRLTERMPHWRPLAERLSAAAGAVVVRRPAVLDAA
jgi:tetratricopeptide (TPR) repeat protein